MKALTLAPVAFANHVQSTHATLIDTRLRADFDTQHLPASHNHCVFEVGFLDAVRALAPNGGTPLALYGFGDSGEANVAADKLLRAGYDNLCLLEGGLDAWLAAGFPVEGSGKTTESNPHRGHWGGWRTVDPVASWMEWSGRNLGTKHWGSVAIESGSIQFVDGAPHRGRVTVAMNTLTNSNLEGNPLREVLEAHLRSDDFFHTERFPQAVFEMEAIDPLPDGGPGRPNLEIRGALTLCGQREPLSFQATCDFDAKGQWIAQAHFDVDRTRWGIIYGSSRFFRSLGMHLVDDQISLQLKIVAPGAPQLSSP